VPEEKKNDTLKEETLKKMFQASCKQVDDKKLWSNILPLVIYALLLVFYCLMILISYKHLTKYSSTIYLLFL
jgi:hypothetical protein